MKNTNLNGRIASVDVIRGFAIAAIMLLHNIEHFDFIYRPEALPDIVKTIDKSVFDAARFLFGGKAYAIFALLFGFTFFLQVNRQEKSGKDFSGRFAWRMLLLLILGIVNSAFYLGDILMLYAVIAFFLIPVYKLSNRVLLIIAVICLLQPFVIFSIVKIISDPLIEAVKVSYFRDVKDYLSNGSFLEVLWGNLTIGKKAVWWWSLDKGRFLQIYALFLLGYLAGRKDFFSPQNVKLWRKILLYASVAAVILYFTEQVAVDYISRKAVSKPLGELIAGWHNFAFMLCWITVFNLLLLKEGFLKSTRFLGYLGRMSLTNYLMQSIVGSFVYYGYGLGLYYYTGASYSLLIGIILLSLQILFCKWWLSKHSRGPLEDIWHKATWLGTDSKKQS